MSAPLRLVHAGETPRELPSNVEAEQGLLGALLLDNRCYGRIADLVTPDDFFEQVHRTIFETAIGLIQDGKLASPITMKTYLGDADLGGITPAQYMARLAAEAVTTMNAPDYATIVRDLAVRRRIIAACDVFRERAYEARVEASAVSLMDEFESEMSELRPAISSKSTGYEDIGTAAQRAADAASRAYRDGVSLLGLSTGLGGLDDVIGGLQRSDLLIIAGRPGNGKTALATNIAVSVAMLLRDARARGEKTGVVGFNSLEMSSEQLAQRSASEMSMVPTWKLRRAAADEHEVTAFIDAASRMRDLPLKIDQTGAIELPRLAMRARELKKRHGLALLVVDYLQLLTMGRRSENRTQEVTAISAGLKALAKELDVPIIALSQLSRQVESREDKRPMLADLRESGSIEQDADVVVFVYREEYYLRKQEPQPGSERHAEWQAALARAEGVGELIIGKNRHGPETTIRVGFDASLTRFHNNPPERPQEAEERRERKRKISLPKEASICNGVLRNLSLTHSIALTPLLLGADRNLPKGVRLIPVAKAREVFGREALGPEAEGAEIEKRFREAMKALRAADLAFWSGTKDEPYVWLKEMVEP